MRALLVQGRSGPTYWSYDYTLPLVDKDAPLPPLGLVTLAALLPASWELRLVDLHVEELDDVDLAWADAVLVTGMVVQADSMREVLARARRLGKRTVAGGPGPTTSPEAFPEADHVFCGEAEGKLDLLVRALEGRVDAPRDLTPPGGARPDLATATVPRFDLLELRRYASLSVQYSRGCPFHCEFCDIIEIFGQRPRVKSADQVLAELEELHRLGGRGSLFFVDDNFIGNRREVAKLLPRLARWQEEHGRPFDLYTEASLDLASEPALVQAMVDAGFSAVFLGIETPSRAALEGAGKRQNMRLDPREAVARLTAAGLEVFAGFIIGFDADGPDIFDTQIEFIAAMPIPRAMIGLLSALPGTALWRRLAREGRLRGPATGDQFFRPNFRPAMDEEQLLAGYRRVLATLYSDEAFYERCRLHVTQAAFGPASPTEDALRKVARLVVELGVKSPRRRHFWSLLRAALPRGPRALVRALSLAAMGEHMVRYTREVVLPRLDCELAELRAERAREGLTARPAREAEPALQAAAGA